LAIVLVSGMIPIGTAQEDDEANTECVLSPDLEVTYEWAYELANGRTRYVEVIDQAPATTPQGHYNITKFGFEEQNGDGERKAWGRQVRMASDTPAPWSLLTQDRWERTGGEEIRRMDSYDPSFRVALFAQETCPGRFWEFTTNHTTQYGEYGQAGSDQADETWQVRVGSWENVTVPAGTFEVLPVKAVRTADEYTIRTYWSPEARAPALVEQVNPTGTDTSRELTWYILDERPTPLYEVTPVHPEVGDNITLDASASYDPEGNITEYRWNVDGETYHGRVVTINATEEGIVDIRLFVTDEANRTTTLGTTRYVGPAEGSGVGITGPTEAYSGQVVTLEAHASFDPVEIRWQEDGQVVGEGAKFQFRIEQTRNLTANAFHESGHVYTANHSVELLDRGEDQGSNASSDEGWAYPPGASARLAILEPLEGQIVSPTFEVRVKADTSAVLKADNRPVWNGTADPSELVTVPLDEGDHTLSLESGSERRTVNVTVAEGGSVDAGATNPSAEQASGEADPSPAPGPAVVGVLFAFGLAGTLATRRYRSR
jgi:hypothetical protein